MKAGVRFEKLALGPGGAVGTLAVDPGERVALIGDHIGDTDRLLEACLGFSKPSQVDVIVDLPDGSIRLSQASSRQIRSLRGRAIAWVPRTLGLLPWQSVRENVTLGLQLSHRDHANEALVEVMRLLSLSAHAELPVGELPLEVRIRVAFARALATGASVLLLQDPFGELPPTQRQSLARDIAVVVTRLGRTLLVSTDDPLTGWTLTDRAAVIGAGQLLQTGPWRQLIGAPVNALVRDRLAGIDPGAVLTGLDVARPLDDNPGGVFLDPEHVFRLERDGDGVVLTVEKWGRPVPLVAAGDNPSIIPAAGRIAIAPAAADLNALVALLEATAMPVLLTDQGRITHVLDAAAASAWMATP
jgi:glycine betaine/proline transport system ATP-binding protein